MTTEQLKEFLQVLSVLSTKLSMLKARHEFHPLMENQQAASEEVKVILLLNLVIVNAYLLLPHKWDPKAAALVQCMSAYMHVWCGIQRLLQHKSNTVHMYKQNPFLPPQYCPPLSSIEPLLPTITRDRQNSKTPLHSPPFYPYRSSLFLPFHFGASIPFYTDNTTFSLFTGITLKVPSGSSTAAWIVWITKYQRYVDLFTRVYAILTAVPSCTNNERKRSTQR